MKLIADKKYFLVGIVLSTLSGVVPINTLAQDIQSSTIKEKKTSTTAVSLNDIMSRIGSLMVEIYPLIVAQRKLTKPETEKIDNTLNQLSLSFKQAKPFIKAKSDGYQVSYEFISDYLDVVKNIIATSHIDNARSHLYALGEICASCHTQDTTLRTLFSDSFRSYFVNDLAYAEFNFITRNYPVALEHYEKFLESPGKKTEIEIIQPLQRALTVYIQVRNDPAGAIIFLKRYRALKNHTPETKQQLDDWLTGLEKLQSSGNTKINNGGFSTLESYVEKYLGQSAKQSADTEIKTEDEILLVWLRGQLFHYLNEKPGPQEIPKILYWLAVIDRHISYNYYFSLADLYLKQCVLKYSNHSIAKQCLNEYKKYVTHMYDKDVPPGIRLEMQKLEQALK